MTGPRLERLFEAQCDRLSAEGQASQVAVHAQDAVLTYHQLDQRANQLARYLIGGGAQPGDRIGLLLDRGPSSYVAMLAVLKIHATYVPLDVGFPADRISYITSAAGIRILLTETSVADPLLGGRLAGAHPVFIDTAARDIDSHDRTRLRRPDSGNSPAVDEPASLIYPAGPSARSDGVRITHDSICQFAMTAAKLFGITPRDRVYEALSTEPDFSVEAIWVAWMVGATLITKAPGPRLRGHELHQFLVANRVSALCCTPGELGCDGEQLPGLRVLAVSGRACPRDLLARWHRPGRRVISVYGTTEPNPPVAEVPVLATGDIVQCSGAGVTVHMTPMVYQQTSDDHLRRLLID